MREIVHLRYADHYSYTGTDVRKIIHRFGELGNPHKLIVTTEKDAQRLSDPMISDLLTGLPLYMIPIHMEFDPKDDDTLREMVLSYCANAK